jgi:hypothetical protein
MTHLLLHVMDLLERFEQWFDTRFGWFFTNGMKRRQPASQRTLKA